MIKVKGYLAHKTLKHMGTPAETGTSNTMTGAISSGKLNPDNSFKITGSGVASLTSTNKIPVNIKAGNKTKMQSLVKTIF
jgi:hypothetical protein